MDVSKIFAEISAMQVEGMTFHDQMADYYDFLDLKGFKRMHEYHFLKETAEMRGLHRYYINHYNRLLEDATVNAKSFIPQAWYGQERQSVDRVARKNAVQSCMEAWCEWERHVKHELEEKYSELCSMKEIAAAMKVKSLLESVDHELKRADRLHIELKSIDYDLPYIFYMQDELHEKYKCKQKKIGVSIC